MTPLEYLTALYGQCEPFYGNSQIVIVDADGKTRLEIFECDQLEDVAEFVEGRECFVKVNPINAKKMLERNSNGIGSADDVTEIVAIGLDVDCGKGKYATRETMLAALAAMPYPPSLLINSNGPDGGFHAYWLLSRPHYINDEQDRTRCKAIAKSWLAELHRIAKTIDSTARIDGTADLCRLLRPVGSVRKSGNVVGVHEQHADRRYDLEDFVIAGMTTQTIVDDSDLPGRSVEDLSTDEARRWVGSKRKAIESTWGNRSDAVYSLMLLGLELGLSRDAVFADTTHEIPKLVENNQTDEIGLTHNQNFDVTWENAKRDWAAKQVDVPRSAIACLTVHRADIVSLANLIHANPTQSESLIEGLLRCGETMNLIASTKVGKSWLASQLAFSVAQGLPFLGRQTLQRDVLIIDYELQASCLADRLKRVALSLGVDHNGIDILSLRGRPRSIIELVHDLIVLGKEYGLVILDTLSRSLPKGTSENDNAQMIAIYSEIDSIAERTGAAVVIVHHSTKGSQSDKTTTDIGSGAGGISRSTDTHCTIRPHETDGLSVLDAVCRSFPSPKPTSIRFDFPIWYSSDEPPQVAIQKSSRDKKQAFDDETSKADILEILSSEFEPIQQSVLLGKLSMGVGKFDRIIKQMVLEDRTVHKTKLVSPGKKRFEIYYEIALQLPP